jgi:hypothetical protein
VGQLVREAYGDKVAYTYFTYTRTQSVVMIYLAPPRPPLPFFTSTTQEHLFDLRQIYHARKYAYTLGAYRGSAHLRWSVKRRFI